jgi:hypothetical protein
MHRVAVDVVAFIERHERSLQPLEVSERFRAEHDVLTRKAIANFREQSQTMERALSSKSRRRPLLSLPERSRIEHDESTREEATKQFYKESQATETTLSSKFVAKQDLSQKRDVRTRDNDENLKTELDLSESDAVCQVRPTDSTHGTQLNSITRIDHADLVEP